MNASSLCRSTLFVPPLTPGQKAVRDAIRDARGFYATRGLSVMDVIAHVARKTGAFPSTEDVEATLNELRLLGFAKSETSGDGITRWKVASRG